MTNNERFNQLLNSCQNPRAICAALLALGKAGVLDKLRKETHTSHLILPPDLLRVEEAMSLTTYDTLPRPSGREGCP